MGIDDGDVRRIGWWVQAARPDELRVLRSAVAAEIAGPPALPATDEVERSTRPMRWLLERCVDAVTLTQSGYLPPSLVEEAVEIFDWWPFAGRPRSEVDVFQIDLLRTIARRLRLLFRRGRRLSTSTTGRGLLADPPALWRALTHELDGASEYDRLIGELVALRLLNGPADENGLVTVAAQIIRAQLWGTGGRLMTDDEIRWTIHEPLPYWRLWGWLDERQTEWRPDHTIVTPWRVAFTPGGRLAALSYIRSCALTSEPD